MTIALIGHSNWKLEDFVNHLTNSGVTMLMDVRSKPYSRYCPWFNQASVEAAVRRLASSIAGAARPWAAFQWPWHGPGSRLSCRLVTRKTRRASSP